MRGEHGERDRLRRWAVRGRGDRPRCAEHPPRGDHHRRNQIHQVPRNPHQTRGELLIEHRVDPAGRRPVFRTTSRPARLANASAALTTVFTRSAETRYGTSAIRGQGDRYGNGCDHGKPEQKPGPQHAHVLDEMPGGVLDREFVRGRDVPAEGRRGHQYVQPDDWDGRVSAKHRASHHRRRAAAVRRSPDRQRPREAPSASAWPARRTTRAAAPPCARSMCWIMWADNVRSAAASSGVAMAASRPEPAEPEGTDCRHPREAQPRSDGPPRAEPAAAGRRRSVIETRAAVVGPRRAGDGGPVALRPRWPGRGS